MELEERALEFKKDLKELLKKHSAMIWADVRGDTYGIESEDVVVSFSVPFINRSGKTVYTETDGVPLGEFVSWGSLTLSMEQSKKEVI